jgi:proline iminopeptidase
VPESHLLINGIRHWVRTAGDLRGRPPLVVLHGGPGGTIYDFERLTGPALERLIPVVYYEQRGSGRSDRPPDGAYSMPLLVQDLEQLRKHLAAEYTVAHPERVDRLILHGTAIAGPLTPSTWGAGFEAVATDDQMRRAIRAAVRDRGPDAVRGSRCLPRSGYSPPARDAACFRRQRALP